MRLATVTLHRPKRSAGRPPTRPPKAPTAITENPANRAEGVLQPAAPYQKDLTPERHAFPAQKWKCVDQMRDDFSYTRRSRNQSLIASPVLNRYHGPEHRLVQADCLEWIAVCKARYDLIYPDPPTFSNSKRMETSFDIQRDHMDLLTRTLRLLNPGAFDRWRVKDISSATLPMDFQRNPHIHRALEIRKKQGNSRPS